MIALGFTLAGNNIEAAASLYAQVAASRDRGTNLGDVAAVVFCSEAQAVGYLHGRDVHVSACAEREVPAGLQHAAKAFSAQSRLYLCTKGNLPYVNSIYSPIHFTSKSAS